LGDPAGTCDEAVESLQKIISTALFEITNGPSIPEALKSPAYHAIKEFSISDLQMTDMFARWHDRSTDKLNFGSRDAACEWIVDNFQFMESFVPPNYPRAIQTRDGLSTVSIIALCLAAVSLVLALVSGGVTYVQREKPAMKRAQVFFLELLLAGLLLVAIGGVVSSLPPSDGTCIASAWLINFGYSVELVPLVVKSAALNHVMGAGRRMKRLVLKQQALYRAVALISTMVAMILVVWTVVDPPLQQTEYFLTQSTNEAKETIIEEDYHCQSDSLAWRILSFSWQMLLLLIAGVLAFQNRNYRNDLTEVRTLALMIYSHVVFLGLRGATFLLESSVGSASLHPYRSLIYSADVVATLTIYFLPKFFDQSTELERGTSFITSGSLRFSAGSMTFGESQTFAVKPPEDRHTPEVRPSPQRWSFRVKKPSEDLPPPMPTTQESKDNNEQDCLNDDLEQPHS